MSELKNFPFKDQLSATNLEGKPEADAREICVATSIAAGLQFLTGRNYGGGQVKDVVYGEAYVGCTAVPKYVNYAAKQGVKLAQIDGHQAQLLAAVHQHLAAGHPVLGFIESTYLPPVDPANPTGMTHCIVFYKDVAGFIVAMNPWHAFAQSNSDEWWQSRLCYNQVWSMELLKSTKPEPKPAPKPIEQRKTVEIPIELAQALLNLVEIANKNGIK